MNQSVLFWILYRTHCSCRPISIEQSLACRDIEKIESFFLKQSTIQTFLQHLKYRLYWSVLSMSLTTFLSFIADVVVLFLRVDPL